MKKPKHMLTGLAIGDFKFIPEKMIDEIKKYGDGKVFKYITMQTNVPERGREHITEEFLYEISKYMSDHGIYFTFRPDVRQLKPMEENPACRKECIERVKEIAGEYFMGIETLEFGGYYTSKARSYREGYKDWKYVPKPEDSPEYQERMKNFYFHSSKNPVAGLENAQEAKDTYISQFNKFKQILVDAEPPAIVALEAVTIFPYAFEAGADFCVVEVAPRNMEQIMNFARGATRAAKCNILGGWLAHEWYGGNRNDDVLKAKRMKIEYMTSYMAGLDFIGLEGGYADIHTFGDYYPEDHPLVQYNLKTATDFAHFANEDVRPGESGPITKVAFVQGNLDGFGWGNSSSLWGQYDVEKWGFAAPEFSYRVLDDVYRSCEWHDAKNCGDYDLSHSPGYGQYDVIPATCPLEVLKRYDWVIFCGWNTMTKEILDTFKAYVKEGGRLLVTAAHLRDSIERDKKGEFVDKEGLEEFLGIKFKGSETRTNDGYKFARNSIIPGVMYPGTLNFYCDPCWSAGYTNYVDFEITNATPVCYLSDTIKTNDEHMWPCVTENKYGDGYVIFMGNSEYPGAPEVFPLYRMMVKNLLTASHRMADIKVISSDKIRFAVYEDEKMYKMYVLNTDYNLKQDVIVDFKGERREFTINSCEFKILEFKK